MVEFVNKSFKARIELKIDSNTRSLTITPYNAIAVNFSRVLTVIDSVDDANIGYTYGNRRYTFYIEVFPIRGADASDNAPLYVLNNHFLDGEQFTTTLNPIEKDISAEGNENTAGKTWAYDKLKLLDCVLTTGGVGTYDSTANLKIIRFDGLCLGVEFDGKVYR